MYTVASPDPDPNRRGGGQLPNPIECNSTLTSGTKNIYPYPIDVNDRGHRLRSGSPLQIGVTASDRGHRLRIILAQRPDTTCGHSLVLDTSNSSTT